MSAAHEKKTPRFTRLEIFSLVVAFVAIALVHAPILGYKMYANVDEAYASALASRLLDGWKLYQGAVSQRGPLMYYIFAAIAWLHGWDNIVALRVWALGLALSHVGLVFWAARALLPRNAAALSVLCAAYALAFGYPPEDAIAVNGEPLQLPALMVAVVVGAQAVRFSSGSRGRTLRLVGAGVAFGIATSIKQSAALHPIPLVLWLMVDARRNKLPLASLVRDIALLTIGTLVVPVALVVQSIANGTFSDLYYYCVVYNRDVHLKPTTKHFAWLPVFFFRLTSQTLFFTITAVLAALAWLSAKSRIRTWRATKSVWALLRGFTAREYIALHFIFGAVAASAMYRFFPHYYLQCAPFMALALGAFLERAFRVIHFERTLQTSAYAFGFLLLASGGFGCYFGEKIDGRVAHDETVNTMSKLIEATTKPTDRIFVWGFSPWIYGYSHRKPAGRYMFETYVTGFVPWYWEKLEVERARIVPGSVEALLGDLEKEDPQVIVDAGSVMMARSMRLYEKPQKFLEERYCFDVRIGALDLYRRKKEGEGCPSPWLPRPFATIDYMGRLMLVPTPLTLDAAKTKRLPLGAYVKPTYFLDRATPPIGLDAIIDKKRAKEENEARSEGFFVPELEP